MSTFQAHKIQEVLENPDLLEAVIYVFQKIHRFPSELAPLPKAFCALVEKEVLREDLSGFTESFGLRGAYACYEWYRQIFSPDCWAKYLEKVQVRDKCVLDVGCGPGATIAWSLRMGAYRVKGVDVDRVALTIASQLLGDQRRAELTFGDAHALADRDESFDVVLCRVSLNYMRHEVAIREFSRVLKSGGILYLLVHRFWYYFSMLHTGRLRHGGCVIANGLSLSLLGRRLRGLEVYLTESELLRATSLARLKEVELWHPTPFSYYLAGIFVKDKHNYSTHETQFRSA